MRMIRFLLKMTLAAAFGCACAVAAGAPTALRPGVYEARVSGVRPAVLNATWQLRLRGGTFAVMRSGEHAVEGTIRIAGNRITFSDLIGPFRCRGPQAVGIYRWRLAGQTLTLRPIRDPCAGRRTVLSRSFRKVS